MGPDAMILVFWMLSFKPAFHSPLSPSSRGSLVLLHFLPLECIIYIYEVVIFPGNLDFSPAFCMMYSSYKLNKQGDNIQPWCTPLPILNQSTVPCPVLTVASWPAHRFLRRQVRWFGIPIFLRVFPQFIVIHIVKDFHTISEAEVDVFLEFPCFFYDPADVGNLNLGSMDENQEF